jgi:hypothetical protein
MLAVSALTVDMLLTDAVITAGRHVKHNGVSVFKCACASPTDGHTYTLNISTHRKDTGGQKQTQTHPTQTGTDRHRQVPHRHTIANKRPSPPDTLSHTLSSWTHR